MFRGKMLIALLIAAIIATGRVSAEISQAEWEAVKRELAEVKRTNAELQSKVAPVKSKVEKALDAKYGPNANVSTKNGKLSISGLVQVWYYSIENDSEGLFQDITVNDVTDTNETLDNDSFRIRRTELKFTMDIHENVTAVVMFDPAREATSFPAFNSNTGTSKRGRGSATAVQTGAGAVPRLLQDAFINYHGVIPHHDFTIGQYKPFFGEEGIRSSSQLDFVERSFLGQLGDARDIGVTVHGTWWTDRFQYWIGAFNTPGNFLGSGGQFQNRSDDNDEKDLCFRTLVRPVWKNECWGSLELGWSSQFGVHGESSARDPVDEPLAGLNRRRTAAIRHGAWISYMPGGPVKGWWMRGEWAWMKDRHAPSTVIDLQGNGNAGDGNTQTNSGPTSTTGFYVSTGYKISESVFCDSAPSWLRPFEFAARYDQFENVLTADLVTPRKTDQFSTRVWTAGINYYIKGHNAKIQANYNWVDDPEEKDEAGNREFSNVDNNNFVVNFQVAF